VRFLGLEPPRQLRNDGFVDVYRFGVHGGILIWTLHLRRRWRAGGRRRADIVSRVDGNTGRYHRHPDDSNKAVIEGRAETRRPSREAAKIKVESNFRNAVISSRNVRTIRSHRATHVWSCIRQV
jgi:hypothetical protein